jgi:DNA polymerase-3 subunit chi
VHCGVVEVEFHTGLVEPLDHAARLLRKAVRLGERVWVATPHVEALSRRLWAEPEREFFAHARPGATRAVWQRSPVWLLPAFELPLDAADWPAVWVNMGSAAAPEGAHCSRLLELVAAGPDETKAGRERWRAYAARGWRPEKRSDASQTARPLRGDVAG